MKYAVKLNGTDIYTEAADKLLISPQADLSVGSAGSFEFIMPSNHANYGSINDSTLLASSIDVYEDGKLIFFGRPTSYEIDFYKQKRVSCEGALSYLNDSVFRYGHGTYTLSSMLSRILTSHNEQVGQNRKIYAGNILNISQADAISAQGSKFEWDSMSSYEALTQLLVDRYGGYLFTRKNGSGNIILDWVKDPSNLSSIIDVQGESKQPITYSVNLLDVKQSMDMSDYFTQVLPYGKEVATPNQVIIKDADEWDQWYEDNPDVTVDSEEVFRNNKGTVTKVIITWYDTDDYPRPDAYDTSGSPMTVRGVNNGSDIISSAAASTYGAITKVLNYSDEEDRIILKARAQAYLTDGQWDRLTIECSAADINGLDDNNYEPLQLGKMVQVTSTPHLINRQFPITKISYNLASGIKSVTLGTLQHQTLTEYTTRDDDDANNTKTKTSTKNNKKKSDTSKIKKLQSDVNKLKTNQQIGSSGGGSVGDGWNHVVTTALPASPASNTIYFIY